MTSQITTMHQMAVEFIDEARMARHRGEERTAKLFFEKSFNLEKIVEEAIPNEPSYQLTRSVFLRSAATLALDCGFKQEAVRLIQLALSSQPHPAMKPELEALLLTCQRTN